MQVGYTLSDVHELSERVIKAQSLGFNKVCLRLRALVRYGIQQQLRFPAANMTFTRDDNSQYIQSSLPLTLTLTEDAVPNCSLHSNDDGESLTADDNSAWLNRSETTVLDEIS